MWICKNCSEENENNFYTCWNCGYELSDDKLVGGKISSDLLVFLIENGTSVYNDISIFLSNLGNINKYSTDLENVIDLNCFVSNKFNENIGVKCCNPINKSIDELYIKISGFISFEQFSEGGIFGMRKEIVTKKISCYFFPLTNKHEEITKKTGEVDFYFTEYKDLMMFLVNQKIINQLNKIVLERFNSFLTELIEKYTEKLEKSNIKISNIILSIDKDKNGVVDVVESDDFMTLLNKYQNKIIEFDKEYLHRFIKLSNFLKSRKKNIQDVFQNVLKTKSVSKRLELLKILKNQVHNYESLVIHSFNMIVSLEKNDLIIFYEIYEIFDKLNVFNSNWENELSQKLSNLEEGLESVMFSIQSVEMTIYEQINNISYSIDSLQLSLENELSSVNSSLKLNNVISGIQTYQMYKSNKYIETKRL